MNSEITEEKMTTVNVFNVEHINIYGPQPPPSQHQQHQSQDQEDWGYSYDQTGPQFFAQSSGYYSNESTYSDQSNSIAIQFPFEPPELDNQPNQTNLPDICNLMNKEEKPDPLLKSIDPLHYYVDPLSVSSAELTSVEKMEPLEGSQNSAFVSANPLDYASFLQPFPTSATPSTDSFTYGTCDYSSPLQTQYAYDYSLYPPPIIYTSDLYSTPHSQASSLPSTISPTIKIEHSPPPQDPLAKPPPKKRIQAVSCHSNSVCANCGTRDTTLWRRNHIGDIECNACNLYFRKNQKRRPLSLKKDTIMKRNRKPRCESPTPTNPGFREYRPS